MFREWRGPVMGERAYRPPSLAIRDGDWKLFADPNGKRTELYHLPRDPAERDDRSERHPEVVGRLLPKFTA